MSLKLRPAVLAFAEDMERKLRRNDHKGGWAEESSAGLLDKLKGEVQELEMALDDGRGYGLDERDREACREEAADVANFAMMIHDLLRPKRRMRRKR